MRFALAFAEADLATVDAAGLRDYARRLSDFGDVSERRPSRVYVAHPDLTRKDVEAIHEKLVRVFDAITKPDYGDAAVELGITLHLYRLHDAPGVLGRDLFVHVDGAPVDRILYRLIRFIEDLGLDRICRCPAPNCERLFFKAGRKEYCSERCQMRNYMRGYRA